MIKPVPQVVPNLPEIDSRGGVRSAVKAIWEYLRRSFESDFRFKNEVFVELSPLYGELDYSPGGALANGAQTSVEIDVPMATLGWECSVTYDKDLKLLVMGVPYVRTEGKVKVVLFNNTGGNVTLDDGRFRAYVKPRTLSA